MATTLCELETALAVECEEVYRDVFAMNSPQKPETMRTMNWAGEVKPGRLLRRQSLKELDLLWQARPARTSALRDRRLDCLVSEALWL